MFQFFSTKVINFVYFLPFFRQNVAKMSYFFAIYATQNDKTAPQNHLAKDLLCHFLEEQNNVNL